MSYPHGLWEVPMLSTIATPYQASTTAAAKRMTWGPLQYPVKVRGVAIAYATTIAVGASNPVFSLRTGAALGVANTTTIVNVTLPSGSGATVGGRVYYKRAQDTIIVPGRDVTLHVTTASTIAAQRVRASLLVEPVWEQPANLSNMYAAS